MIKSVGLYDSNGVVVNRILIDTDENYTPPDGLMIVDDEDANIGDSVFNGVLVKPA